MLGHCLVYAYGIVRSLTVFYNHVVRVVQYAMLIDNIFLLH